MAKILALDTSTQACSVALDIDGDVDESFVVAPQDHTQRLLPQVHEMLQRHGISLAELDCIAFGAGPGSFTGLRICLGVVQGLAFGADLPVVPLSSLALTAASARRELQLTHSTPILPAFDARMGEVYWGLYVATSEQRGYAPEKALMEDAVATPGDVAAQVQAHAACNQIVGVGDGWACAGMPAEQVARVETEIFPHARDGLAMAELLWRRGEGCSPLDSSPTYIRDEVRWKKRQKIRS